ncbi:hypothetical protein C8Q75DRAFT_275372 [Abortiporus biennis]|nr:hypothetical protein C8Q75DRAFT_275372 [Abortiporus biennis]
MVTSYGVGVLSNGVADECEDRISASPIMIMIVFNLSVRSGGSDYPGSVHGLQSALRSGHGRLSNMFFVLHLQRLSLSPNLTRTIHVTQGDIDMLLVLRTKPLRLPQVNYHFGAIPPSHLLTPHGYYQHLILPHILKTLTTKQKKNKERGASHTSNRDQPHFMIRFASNSYSIKKKISSGFNRSIFWLTYNLHPLTRNRLAFLNSF